MVQNTKLENRKGESMSHSLPDSETLYSALVNRDSNFEGIFVVGSRPREYFAVPLALRENQSKKMSSFLVRRMTLFWLDIGHVRFVLPWNIKELPLTGLNRCWLKSMMTY